ncbi:cyclopropane fatty acyl phospholipid synthase [Salmonella enterica subsp. enterica serovar Mbandaka]|nr:cyclopropane fatty acyl phospholipid synthase [Salmonella enterica subsp. enterica serovar Mbandaka]EED9866611.1 cyclopropane fatty acyl phospholipid synthase [Salmonella enterica subsp. enterica serovar Mbandaka]
MTDAYKDVSSDFSELNKIWCEADISHSSSGKLITQLLASADVKVNGDRPQDIKIFDKDLPSRVLTHGNLALGEAYVAGDWACQSLDTFFCQILRERLDRQVIPLRAKLNVLRERLFNLQSASRAWQVGTEHYDIGNDFYAAMLDKRMTYTCGYWGRGASTLDEAQTAKLDLICQKLELKPGMRLLDIGCGWGSLMGYAAEHYGVECCGVSISREQIDYARKRYEHLPVEFRLMDYRDLDEKFDRIASVGMFEHVGGKNYKTYMQVAQRCLSEEGIFLLHTIGKNIKGTPADPWIDKYIFPNGILPAMNEIIDAAEGIFVIEDVHNFGADYDRTLMMWYKNFVNSWPTFSGRMGDEFYRMWSYYLLSCAGAFRARDIQLWQFVLTKNGLPGGYTSIR